MVQKVSAIVAGQTHEIHGSSWDSQTYVDKEGRSQTAYHTVPYNATQTSILAQKLEPPKQPKAPETNGFGWTIGFIGFFTFACLFFGWPFLLLIPFFLMEMIIAPFNSETPFSTLDMPLRILTSIGGIVLTVIVVILTIAIARKIFRRISNSSKKATETHERQIAEVKAETPRWQHAMENWNQLYYCKRDDIVFVPNKNDWESLDKMMTYIYK